MSGKKTCQMIVAAVAVALAAAACENEVNEPEACATLSADDAREACASFRSALEEDGSETEGASDEEISHVVFRSYCNGDEHRVDVRAEDRDEGIARAIERHWRQMEPDEDCTMALELLSPRMDPTRWAAADSFDQYVAYIDGLAIHNEPVEIVTPLDFSTVRPDESLETLRQLPHLYKRAARDRDYLDEGTVVQPLEVDAYVLRDGSVAPTRYHRVRREEVDEEALVRGVRRAAQSLEEMRYEGVGRFYYEYDPYRDEYEKSSYNLLRHAGTTWSIMQAYGLTGDRRFRELGEYGLDWLVEQSRTDTRQGRTIRYVVESWNNKAKLGGAGLWLLALAEHARLTGDSSNYDLMQEIANHIYLSQDAETGKFETFYAGDDDLSVTDHESDYYPGEAMFGLHRAEPFIDDIPVCEVTEKGLEYLLEDEPRELPAEEYRFVNQWNVYSIREYRRDCDDDKFDWLWEREIEHMLTSAATLEDDPVMAGAYLKSDGQVNPSATRLEALTVICTELGSEDAEMAEKCEPVMERVGAMQLSYQHGPENSWLWPNPEAVNGGFPRDIDDERVRIDFTQHHLSAMYNNVAFLRDVVGDGDQDERATLTTQGRSWPFNLVGDATCDKIDEIDCL